MSKDASKRKLSPATAFAAVFSAVAGDGHGHLSPASKGSACGSILRRMVTFSLALALLISAAAPLAPQAAAHNQQETAEPADASAEQPADQPLEDEPNQNTSEPADTPSDEQASERVDTEAAEQAGERFGTLPPGSTLPTGEECANLVRRAPWEPRAENYEANHTPGKAGVQIDGANDEANELYAPRIDGNFTGTTDEIIQWGACKWGFDEDIIRAVAVNESTWRQSMVGDGGHSYGLLQVKDSVHDGTFPTSQDSTAFNVDYALAWRRSCFEGHFDWANMPAGNDEWDCVGLWYSGDPNGGADNYLAEAKGHYQEKPWLDWPDESSTLPADAETSPAPDADSGIPAPETDTGEMEPGTDLADPAADTDDTTDDAIADDDDTIDDVNADAGDISDDADADAGDNSADANTDIGDTSADAVADTGDTSADAAAEADDTSADASADTDATKADTAKKQRDFSISAYIRMIFELCDPREWLNHAESGEPEEPSDSAPLAESAEPSPSTEPAESPESVESSEPVESTEPVESLEPVESSEPVEALEPVESPEPSPSDELAESPEPSPSTEPAPVTETGSDISGLHVQGNQLLNGAGQAVQLRGVNRSGTEYSCIQGNGFFDGPNDQASIDAIKSWNVNVVRVPMNEHCWLAVNGAPEEYSGEKYQQAIKDYVDLLTKNGIATILELHWSAPGGEQATGQKPMLNKDHSIEFWKQVADTFKDNSSVIFDPHNEPHPDGNKDTDAAWTCWRDGGNCSGLGFEAAGMQEIVDTIRGTGAKNVVILGGVQYSNGLSKWLEYKPNDPENNLMASWHIYPFNPCNSTECYDKTLKPVSEQVPIMAGEIGQDDCGDGFIKDVMNWLDNNGGHYAGWVWNTWGTDCGSISLITDYDGTPNGTYGQGFKDHLTSS